MNRNIEKWSSVMMSVIIVLALVGILGTRVIPTQVVEEYEEVMGVTTTEWTEISVGGNTVPLLAKDASNNVVMFQASTDGYYQFNTITKQFDLIHTSFTSLGDYRYTANWFRSSMHELLANRTLPTENYFPANLVSCPNGDVYIVGRAYGHRWSDGTGSWLSGPVIFTTRVSLARITSSEMTSYLLDSESPYTIPDEINMSDPNIVPFYSSATVCTPEGELLTVEVTQVEDFNLISSDPFVYTLEAPEYFMFNTVAPAGTLESKSTVRMPGIGVNSMAGPGALFYFNDQLYLLRSDGIFSVAPGGAMTLAYDYPVSDANHYAEVINNENRMILIVSDDLATSVYEEDSGWSLVGDTLPAADGAQIITYGEGYMAILDHGLLASVYYYNPNNNTWSQVGDDLVADNILQDVLIQHVGSDVIISFIDREESDRYARSYYLTYDVDGGVTPTPTATATATPTATTTVTPTVTITSTPTATITNTPVSTVTATPTVSVTGTVTPSVSTSISPSLTTFPSYIPPNGDDIDDGDIDETPDLPFIGNVTPSVDYNNPGVNNDGGFLSGELIGMQMLAQVVLVGAIALDFMGPFLAAALSTHKKKEGFAGVVYDAVAKTPVARAVVRVFGEDEKLLQTLVTDIHGVFQLSKLEGEVQLKVQHAKYTFPSILIITPSDGEYQKIYKGEKLQVEPGEPVVCSIPVDPVDASSVSRVRVYVENIVRIFTEYAFEIIYLLLLVYSGYIFFKNPTLINGLLFAVPFVVIIVKALMKESTNRYGVVKTVNGTLVKGVQVGLYDPEFKTLVYTTYTNNLGEYSFIVENKEYVLRVMDEKYTLIHNNVQVEEVKIAKSDEVGIVRIVRNNLLLRATKAVSGSA